MLILEGHRDPCPGSRMSGSLLSVENLDSSGNFRSWGSTSMSSGSTRSNATEMLHDGWCRMMSMVERCWESGVSGGTKHYKTDLRIGWICKLKKLKTFNLKHLTRPRVGLRQLLKSFAPRKHYPCHGDWPCTTKIVGYAVAWVQKEQLHAAVQVFASSRPIYPMRSRTTSFALQWSFEANQLSVATVLDCSSMGNQTDTENPIPGEDTCIFQHQSSQILTNTDVCKSAILVRQGVSQASKTQPVPWTYQQWLNMINPRGLSLLLLHLATQCCWKHLAQFYKGSKHVQTDPGDFES